MSLSEPQAFADPASLAFPRTLYRPVEERDAWGTGFVASLPQFWKVSPKPPEGLREPPPRVVETAAEPATAGTR